MSYYDDDDYRPPQTRWEDEWGCLFPGECCMPGEHRKSECHTAEDIEAWSHPNTIPMSMSDSMTLTAEQRAMLGRLIDAFEMESICGVDFAAPFDERLKLIDDCRDLLGVHRGWSVPGETN